MTPINNLIYDYHYDNIGNKSNYIVAKHNTFDVYTLVSNYGLKVNEWVVKSHIDFSFNFDLIVPWEINQIIRNIKKGIK